MRGAAVLLLMLSASASVPARAQGLPATDLDLPAFIDVVTHLAATIERAAPHEVTPILVGMPSRLRVRLGEQHFDVPFEPIAQRLAQARNDPARWAERRHEIHLQLLSVKADAEALLNGSGQPRARELRRSLETVLARREFTRHQSSEFLARLRQRISESIRRLMSRLGGEGVDTRRFAVVLAWVVTLGAVAGLVLWLYRTTRRSMLADRMSANGAAVPPTPSREWGLRAMAAAREGRSSEAVRCMYRAALKRFEEQGTWRVEDSRTAREYVGMLPAGDTRRDLFRDIVRHFEQTLYGNRTLGTDELARLAHHLETLGCVRAHERTI